MFHIHNATIISLFRAFSTSSQQFNFFWELAFTSVKWISKKAFCSCRHSAQARVSGLASSYVCPSIPSLSIFCKAGSISTSFWIVFSRSISKSLTLICLITTNPPLLQFRAWFRLYFWLHGHLLGIPCSCLLYQTRSASLNSDFVRAKPYSCISITTSQLYATPR